MSLKPKLVLIVGDGFSRGFLRHVGLSEKIVTHSLVPPPDFIRFRPRHVGDPEPGPLWREDLFEELWRAWHERILPDSPETSGQERYRKLLELSLRIGAPKMPSDGGFPFEDGRRVAEAAGQTFHDDVVYTSGLNVELRSYIWHLMTEYDRLIRKALEQVDVPPVDFFSAWEWGQILQRMVNEFDCSFISYNYDLNLERVLSALGMQVLCPTSAERPLGDLARNQCLVFKPHGSINFATNFGFYKQGMAPFKGVAFVRGIIGNPTQIDLDYQESRPDFIDLVPPGHAGEGNLVNPVFDGLREATRDLIRHADAVVLCGLSAAEPDTPEMEHILSSLRGEALAVHVGLSEDRNSDAARILREHAGIYRFVAAGEGRKLAIPDELWNLALRASPAAELPSSDWLLTPSGLVVESFQPVGTDWVSTEGIRSTCGTMFCYLRNESGAYLEGCALEWRITIGPENQKVVVPVSWSNLNFEPQSGFVTLQPKGRITVPILMAELPLDGQSTVSFLQDADRPSSLVGTQVVLFPQLKLVEAELVLVDKAGTQAAQFECRLEIDRKAEEIRIHVHTGDLNLGSKLIWRVNK